jgi:hypothetical protein
MQQQMPLNDIITRMRDDIAKQIIKVVNNDGYRYYTDTLTETLIIPITTPEETARLYEKVVINAQATQTATHADPFLALPRVSMFIGQPDTGKTYQAFKIAEQCGIDPLMKMCRDNLNLETLLEDFKLVDGKPVFEESLAIKLMSGTDRAIIIFDEFNTLLTGVMKTMQPIFDDTSTTFEYRGKVYKKNMNCKFIVTLNDKDKGISIVPDAILSRATLRWFEPVSPATIAKWTGAPLGWVQDMYQIYKILGLLSIFGTRQIKMLRQLNDLTLVKNHLYGLCMMKNIDGKAIETLQVQTLINKL